MVVRGSDLSPDLIGKTTAAEYFYVLLTGQRPTAQQAGMLDACIVALAEHGLVPSVQAARMTYASSPEALHGAATAGLLGAGSVILGSSEDAAVFRDQIVGSAAQRGVSLQEAALDAVRERRAARKTVPGVGHPLHRDRDPRAEALLAYGDRLGVNGTYVESADGNGRRSAGGVRAQLCSKRLRSDPGGADGRGLPAGGDEGRAADRAHDEPGRAPDGGAGG